MAKGSRDKGSRAELEIAARLKAWWDGVNPAAVFKRVPLSGGWGDKEARHAFRAAGDVMTDCTKFPFSVEVKRREGWSLPSLLSGGKSPVWGWWRQAIGQAKEQGGIPLLFLRHNHETWKMIMPFDPTVTVIGAFEHPLSWFQSSFAARGVDVGGVTPTFVAAERFFASRATDWLEVVPTFSRG